MDLNELKKKLYDYNVPERWYSIDNGLKYDACVLYRNYSKWEYFYLDERGNRLDYKILDNDSAAYEHLWTKIEYQLRIFKVRPRDVD